MKKLSVKIIRQDGLKGNCGQRCPLNIGQGTKWIDNRMEKSNSEAETKPSRRGKRLGPMAGSMRKALHSVSPALPLPAGFLRLTPPSGSLSPPLHPPLHSPGPVNFPPSRLRIRRPRSQHHLFREYAFPHCAQSSLSLHLFVTSSSKTTSSASSNKPSKDKIWFHLLICRVVPSVVVYSNQH